MEFLFSARDFIFSPPWFIGKDLVIDAISTAILFLIALYAFSFHKVDMDGRKRYITTSTAFLLLSMSYLIRTITYYFVYFTAFEQNKIESILVTTDIIASNHALFYSSVLLFRFLALSGFYLLFLLYFRRLDLMTKLLIWYLILVSLYLSFLEPFVYNLTAFMFLAGITVHHIQNMTRYKCRSTKMITVSFIILAITQLVLSLKGVDVRFYAAAKMIQMVGYGLLLITFAIMKKNGKRQDRHNL
ncbi:hypothetical protein COT47_02510 [Candidatus Woesearchaeota archaeon CG08_land_8_20_14_0_20_43_7]|nr:MAG: hypothetical protein COT47_02510 [Candidatus Woesearchaeota archaeon CG08_land_8_20_14_0_20_43_7]